MKIVCYAEKQKTAAQNSLHFTYIKLYKVDVIKYVVI